jgi:uncharacterized Zn-finger protein
MLYYVQYIPRHDPERRILMPERNKWEYHELVITGEGATDFYVCPKCKGAFATDLCQVNGAFEIDAGESFKFCPYCGKELGGVERET